MSEWVRTFTILEFYDETCVTSINHVYRVNFYELDCQVHGHQRPWKILSHSIITELFMFLSVRILNHRTTFAKVFQRTKIQDFDQGRPGLVVTRRKLSQWLYREKKLLERSTAHIVDVSLNANSFCVHCSVMASAALTRDRVLHYPERQVEFYSQF